MTISLNNSTSGGSITFSSANNNTLTIDGNIVADNLSRVAHSGSYNDLTDKPAVNQGTITQFWTSDDNTESYRVWSNGFKEVWIKHLTNITFNQVVTFTLPIEFDTTNYIVVALSAGSHKWSWLKCRTDTGNGFSTSSFVIQAQGDNGGDDAWQSSYYIAGF